MYEQGKLNLFAAYLQSNFDIFYKVTNGLFEVCAFNYIQITMIH